jgi:two-component system, OmpR family, response regulator RpaB
MSFSERTVLIADDMEEIRLMLKQAMLMNGYSVVEATNGIEAVEAARQARPDLVLIDLNMPEMDGLKAIEEIRKIKGEQVPIVAMTAFDTYGMKEAAIQVGCNEYLNKPLNISQLESLVRDYLTTSV